jgi:hypothetical protein
MNILIPIVSSQLNEKEAAVSERPVCMPCFALYVKKG